MRRLPTFPRCLPTACLTQVAIGTNRNLSIDLLQYIAGGRLVRYMPGKMKSMIVPITGGTVKFDVAASIGMAKGWQSRQHRAST